MVFSNGVNGPTNQFPELDQVKLIEQTQTLSQGERDRILLFWNFARLI